MSFVIGIALAGFLLGNPGYASAITFDFTNLPGDCPDIPNLRRCSREPRKADTNGIPNLESMTVDGLTVQMSGGGSWGDVLYVDNVTEPHAGLGVQSRGNRRDRSFLHGRRHDDDDRGRYSRRGRNSRGHGSGHSSWDGRRHDGDGRRDHSGWGGESRRHGSGHSSWDGRRHDGDDRRDHSGWGRESRGHGSGHGSRDGRRHDNDDRRRHSRGERESRRHRDSRGGHSEIEKGEFIELVFPQTVTLTGIEFMDPDHNFEFGPGQKYGRAAFDLFVDLILVLDEFDVEPLVDLTSVQGLTGNNFRFKADHSVDRFYIRLVTFEPVEAVPVSEPSALLFLGAGIAGLGLFRRCATRVAQELSSHKIGVKKFPVSMYVGLLVWVFFAATTSMAQAATIELTGTVRDFCAPAIDGTCIDHPDFEKFIGSDPGIVQEMLGADKKPVYTGTAGNPTTTGQANFDQWYRDVAGVNQSTSLTITLDNTITPEANIFTYDNQSFFPIDGQLFGDQGRSHNYSFTFELHTEFDFLGSESFTIRGDDDIWVFIDNKLAADLGGIHPASTSVIDLSSLGLTPGNTYDLDIFFAERHTTGSSLRIDTSLALEPAAVPEPGGFSLLTFGLALLCFMGWWNQFEARVKRHFLPQMAKFGKLKMQIPLTSTCHEFEHKMPLVGRK